MTTFNPEIFEKAVAMKLSETDSVVLRGRIHKVIGLVIESEGPRAPIGEVCSIKDKNGKEVCKSEIVGFKDGNKILSMALGEVADLAPGMEIVALGKKLSVKVGDNLLGRVIDGLGEPIDNLGNLNLNENRSIYALPPNPLLRQRITEPISTGIRALDGISLLEKVKE
ncbi:hypothetical protein MASR1M45_30090 [Candidatus Kapaibacterium sp.]